MQWQQPDNTDHYRQGRTGQQVQGVFRLVFGQAKRKQDGRNQRDQRQEPVGQKTDTDGCAENRGGQLWAPGQEDQCPISGGVRSQRGQHWLRFVCVIEETEAAGQNQWRCCCKVFAMEFSGRQQDEFEGQQRA